ncbi:MAG: CAP domain-containing protein [Patescibacteria group bacterium]|nr:CAP domain-containing protein [Patescibacteria group bacterium]
MAIATKTKKRPTAHAKKRVAKHHRQSKPYLKAYWPYIPMIIIFGVGLLLNSLWAQGNVLGTSVNYGAGKLLLRTNEARITRQENALTLDNQLSQAAQAKAEDMVAHNYWSHDSPQGKTPWSFITASGYPYVAAGENLAYGFDSADQTISGWMNSEDHKANILNETYSNVGFGVAQAKNYLGKGQQTIVVAEYGRPVDAAANITFTVPEPALVAGVTTKREIDARPVSRIQLLTQGKAAWSAIALSAFAGAALTLFIVRHGLRLRRLIVRGEVYVAHHPYMDITLALLITVAFLLTRTSGIIR